MTKQGQKFQSRYSSDTLITPAQYITELICEKKARLAGGELPQKFWTQPKWSAFFRQQVHTANLLLRLYSYQAIIRALNAKEAERIFSLRAPHLDAIIKAEQAKYDKLVAQQESAEDIVRVDVNAKPRQPIVKKNIVSRLKELDNE